MELIRFIVTGLIAGWTLGMVRRRKGYGLIGNLIIGAIGSVIGWFLLGLLQIQNPAFTLQIGMAVVGAVLFFLLMGSLKWKRSKNSKDRSDD